MKISADLIFAIGLFGTSVTVLGILYDIFVARRSNRRKKLTYDITEEVALASVLPDNTGQRLSIVYERDGQEPVNVKSVVVRFIRITNIGRVPIRQEDIAGLDPLRVEITNARVLDLAVDGVSREVIHFSLTRYNEENGATTSLLAFDFLDYLDGALIRVLTDSRSANIAVRGTIIGMPEGIQHRSESTRVMGASCLGIFLSALWVMFLAFTMTRFITIDPSEQVTQLPWYGSVLFFVALFGIPFLLLSLTTKLIVNVRWPSNMMLPEWFVERKIPERR